MHLRALILAMLPACTEYELAEKGGASLPGEDTAVDTAPTGDTAPPACPDDRPEAVAVAVDEGCASEPQIGSFSPVVEWAWTDNPVHPGYHQIMAQPVVGNLTDDNGDGAIDDNDTPDVIFSAFGPTNYRSPGVLVALSGDDGHTLWSSVGDSAAQPWGCTGVAVADVDGTGPSIFATTTGGLTRFHPDGTIEWTTALPAMPAYGHGHPAVADMDGDGLAEIVLGPNVVRADGTLWWSGAAGTGGIKYMSFPMDLDGDGLLEVIAGNTVYEMDGTVRWTVGGDGFAAVADLDLDGSPEIVIAEESGGLLRAVHADGTSMWDFTFTDRGGGPPTIADYDGDGEPEIGLASEQVYRVIEADGTLRWSNSVQDASSQRTGSSVFDFEGDGAAEVVYADEETLWVYDGHSGAVEMARTEHSSGTLYEYPVIVDVDNDGAAEIVSASNDYSSAHNDSHGIVVIGDAGNSWSAARPTWSQHAYSITHVTNDGQVPAGGAPSWASVNSFRAGNSETRAGLAQPDLTPGGPEVCTDECSLGHAIVWVSLSNGGAAHASGTVDVALFKWEGATETLRRVESASLVLSGGQTWLGPLSLTADDFGTSGLLVRVDDDGTGASAWDECDETNNTLHIDAYPCDSEG
jgi:hypothetical protein